MSHHDSAAGPVTFSLTATGVLYCRPRMYCSDYKLDNDNFAYRPGEKDYLGLSWIIEDFLMSKSAQICARRL